MKININILILSLLYNFKEATLKQNDVYHHLGTRTPYRFNYNKNVSSLKFKGCEDTKIWMIIRHGTRLPSRKDILGMNSTLKDLKHKILLQHKLGKGELNDEQLKRLNGWSSNVDIEQEKFLTLEGQDEMVLLAERMQKRFPTTIKSKYNNKTFLFRYTATQRAQQSARYFANGLFKKKDAKNVIFAPATKIDPILRFYKHCDKWQKQVKKNPDTYKEQKLFGKSQEMNKTLDLISKRLGFSSILRLGQVNLMYKICGFETSWNKYQASPWCSPFDLETAEVLEYYHDLKNYWVDGYGNDLSFRQACISIKHMFDNFSNKEGPEAVFLFAHSGTILKILAHMGLYKPDSPLRGDAVVKNRPWRTAAIDCFASNLAFVFYKCKDGEYILTLHQEQIIKLPMCETELCPLENFTEHFRDSIYNCNYTDMCSLDKSDNVSN